MIVIKSLLETTLNTRDLGGYKKKDKTRTKPVAFIRSDVAYAPSEKDIAFLRAVGVTTVIDLRTDDEVKRKASGFAAVDGLRYVHLPIVEGSQVPESCAAVPLSYMLIAAGKSMPQVFATMAAAEGGVLFHCSAGKDRTGVVSAILLLHAGVYRRDIVKNYVLTKKYNRKRLKLVRRNYPGLDMRIVVPCNFYMEEFLRLFTEKYGSTDEYFRSLGLTAEEIKKLSERL